MGTIQKDLLADWSEGCQNSAEPDAVPQSAYIRARNTALTSIGTQKAAVQKRRGMTTLNATAITGSAAIIGIYAFKRRSGSTFTSYNMVVSDNGRLSTIDPDTGAITTISATAFTSSSSQEYLPSFATANNVCFIVNGVDAKKYDGTSLTRVGIVAPSTAPTLADSGVAGSPNGTYEARVTFANSGTGQESSAGTTSSTVTVASKKISFTNIPVSSDAQVDTRYLYLRNTGTQANFYLAGTISDNTTTIFTYNGADAALTEIGPDTEENNPPVSGVKFACFHKSRLFLADTENIYYSKLDMVESFDPEAFETPNPSDGQAITGLISIFDLLVIFKTDSVYVLVGDDPDTWAIRPIDNTIGCSTVRSIVATESILYWYSEQGPVRWTGGLDKPQLLAPLYIANTVNPEVLSFSASNLLKVAAARDTIEDRILWSVPQVNQTRNTLILPFNHRLSRWESDGWDPMDACALATIDDADGQPFVILGNYAGQLFRMGDADNDGVAAGTTMSGTFVASGTSATTITDLAATFDTTGAGLVERKVTIVDSNEEEVDYNLVRHRIASNTATSFTLDSAVANLVDGQTYTYYIGGPAFDWETSWLAQGDPFMKKRYMFLYVHFRAGGSLSNLKMHFYFSYDDNPDTATILTVTTGVDVELWDEVDWDDAIWSGGSDEVQDRFRIGRTGTSMMVRLRHFTPDAELTVIKLGITSEMLSERIT